MIEIMEKAHAKINLTLDVLRRRKDGYHEVEMVMQSLELADTVKLKADKEGIRLHSNADNIPNGPDNLAWRAAQLMAETYGINQGIDITIVKRIPVAAGLAGGSADAAAVIRGINRLWELNLALEELSKLGAKLGSDIPFCILEGTALAKGRGEVVSQLPACPELWLVLIKPHVEVSTAMVYGKFSNDFVLQRPDTAKMISALSARDKDLIIRELNNVLESVTIKIVPEIAEIKQKLLEHGALNALMSGSGPTVFAIAQDEKHAHILAGLFNQSDYQVIVTKTIN